MPTTTQPQPLLDDDPTLPRYVTLQDAARAFAVDVKTIRRKIAAGELPAVRVGTRSPGTIRDTRPIRVPLAALAVLSEPVATVRGSDGTPTTGRGAAA